MINEDFKPIELFDYKEIEDLNTNNDNSLNEFISVPEAIKNLMQFALKTHIELSQKYPNDKYLQDLDTKEQMSTMFSTNWYERYGVTYK
ncbi:MAG: hypothetical protein HRT43_12985 [Campylobacteraceae bacterium]|nr:hypothetical protein [Campylobacteraceae bacterium]